MKMRRRLKVGAEVEDLRGLCPYFYDVAQHLAPLDTSDAQLLDFARNTFRTRYKVTDHRRTARLTLLTCACVDLVPAWTGVRRDGVYWSEGGRSWSENGPAAVRRSC